MPIIQTGYGPKPAQILAGGSPASLPNNSTPFLPMHRSVRLTGEGWRNISYHEIYRQQPVMGMAIRRTASAIARLPIHTYRWLDANGDERERDRQHPGATLLENPRPGRKGFNLRWDIAWSLYTHGHSVTWKRRPTVGAPPMELWQLDWRYLEPILERDGTGPVLGWIWRGHGIPGLRWGDVILPDDVISIGFEAGSSIGVSCLEQLGVTVRSEDAIQRHAEAYFKHGTRFGAAAILDKNVKADQVIRDGVRAEMTAVHGGVDNAYGFAVLGGGVTDLKTIGGQSAQEAELIDQRKVNREEALAALDMPPPLAGFLEDSNYSSIKEVHRLLYVTVLPGSLGLIAAGLQAQLLDNEPGWGTAEVFGEFNLSEVLKGDAKERWETYGVALDKGGLTLNDVRRMENLKPYANPLADEPLILANNVRPLSLVGTPDDTADPPTQLASSILSLVGKHAQRALDRAARKMGEASSAAEALDADRVTRELAEDLKAEARLNGAAQPIAEAVAKDLVDSLDSAASPDDVRRIASDYLGGQE